MSVFSTNQVRQFYVANALKTPNVVATDNAGSIAVKSDSAKSHLYFEYKGADNLMRSDLIDIKNILYAKATDADDMAHKIKGAIITLDTNVNGGKLVVGQDYILRIAFRQFVGMSDEDQYFKYGMVHAYAGMNVTKFYTALAISLYKNFSREVTPLVKFMIADKYVGGIKTINGETVLIDAETGNPIDTSSAANVAITEVEQPWRRGVMEQTPVDFEVQPSTITVNGDEVVWGTVEWDSAGVIDNGKKIADLEYFCMGERGDIYREVGFPNNIPTTYLADPTVKYNTIDIHYAYVGGNESVQKSEKTITLAIPKVGADNKTGNALANSIIAAINTATGLSIATLSVA
nr:MAG TPA: Structural protein [Crassvirales sp.]